MRTEKRPSKPPRVCDFVVVAQTLAKMDRFKVLLTALAVAAVHVDAAPLEARGLLSKVRMLAILVQVTKLICFSLYP